MTLCIHITEYKMCKIWDKFLFHLTLTNEEIFVSSLTKHIPQNMNKNFCFNSLHLLRQHFSHQNVQLLFGACIFYLKQLPRQNIDTNYFVNSSRKLQFSSSSHKKMSNSLKNTDFQI